MIVWLRASQSYSDEGAKIQIVTNAISLLEAKIEGTEIDKETRGEERYETGKGETGSELVGLGSSKSAKITAAKRRIANWQNGLITSLKTSSSRTR